MHGFGVRDKLRESLQGLVDLEGIAANRGRSQPSPSGPLVLTNLTHRLMARGVVVIER
jgi:hypothetical protein